MQLMLMLDNAVHSFVAHCNFDWRTDDTCCLLLLFDVIRSLSSIDNIFIEGDWSIVNSNKNTSTTNKINCLDYADLLKLLKQNRIHRFAVKK